MNVYGFFMMLLLNASLQAKTVLEAVVEYNTPPVGRLIQQQKYLTLAFRNITSLDGVTVIPGIEQAWALTVRGNNINIIKANTFNSPKLKGLMLLDLRDNNIEDIEPGAFNGLDGLLFLLLNRNQLKELKDGALMGLPRVKYVTLGDNPNEHLVRRQAQKQVPNATIFNKEITRKWLNTALKAAGLAVAAGVIAVVVFGPWSGEDTAKEKRRGAQFPGLKKEDRAQLISLRAQQAVLRVNILATNEQIKDKETLLKSQSLDIFPAQFTTAKQYQDSLTAEVKDLKIELLELNERLKTTENWIDSLIRASDPNVGKPRDKATEDDETLKFQRGVGMASKPTSPE